DNLAHQYPAARNARRCTFQWLGIAGQTRGVTDWTGQLYFVSTDLSVSSIHVRERHATVDSVCRQHQSDQLERTSGSCRSIGWSQLAAGLVTDGTAHCFCRPVNIICRMGISKISAVLLGNSTQPALWAIAPLAAL